jgi:hypothetical protein
VYIILKGITQFSYITGSKLNSDSSNKNSQVLVEDQFETS